MDANGCCAAGSAGSAMLVATGRGGGVVAVTLGGAVAATAAAVVRVLPALRGLVVLAARVVFFAGERVAARGLAVFAAGAGSATAIAASRARSRPASSTRLIEATTTRPSTHSGIRCADTGVSP